MELTISQALRRISKLKGALKEQLERAVAAVTYTVDAEPAFKFAASVEQSDIILAELIKLETALRITNAQTFVAHKGGKITLAEATCILQQTRSKIAWLKLLPSQAQSEKKTETPSWDPLSDRRVTVTTITKCDFPEVKRAEAVAKAQEEFDALNDSVEASNHKTTLLA